LRQWLTRRVSTLLRAVITSPEQTGANGDGQL